MSNGLYWKDDKDGTSTSSGQGFTYLATKSSLTIFSVNQEGFSVNDDSFLDLIHSKAYAQMHHDEVTDNVLQAWENGRDYGLRFARAEINHPAYETNSL